MVLIGEKKISDSTKRLALMGGKPLKVKNLNCFKYIGELQNTNSSGESADKNFEMEKDAVLAKHPLRETSFLFLIIIILTLR